MNFFCVSLQEVSNPFMSCVISETFKVDRFSNISIAIDGNQREMSMASCIKTACNHKHSQQIWVRSNDLQSNLKHTVCTFTKKLNDVLILKNKFVNNEFSCRRFAALFNFDPCVHLRLLMSWTINSPYNKYTRLFSRKKETYG